MNSNYQSAYSKSGSSTESRYSKDQLLDFYNLHEKSGFGILNLEDLFVDGWRPAVNGLSNGGWGKRDDHKENNGPELCWDHSGSVQPLALAEMTEEEKEVDLIANFVLSYAVWLTIYIDLCLLSEFSIETPNAECQQGRHS